MARLLAAMMILGAMSTTLIACVDSGRSGKLVSEPEFYARNVKAYGDTAVGLPPDVAYGWDVNVVGEVAHWRECNEIKSGGAPDDKTVECGQVERTRPARDLLGMQHVANVDVDGHEVAVQKLSLAPRPTYIVPNFKPATTTGSAPR